MIISVVIPAYNEEAELPKCLEAVKEAARNCFHPVEIIVVNNASTDMTADVAYGVIVVDEPRKGISFARQRGFESSRGSIVCCIDADTRMPPYWFKRLLNHFDDKVVAVSGPSFFYDLSILQRTLTFFFNMNAYVVYLLTGKMLQGGNFAVLRSALEKAGSFNTSIEFYGEDVDLARRVVKQGKIRWAWDMSMPASGRRLLAEGFIKVGATYALNYISVMFFNGPMTTAHKDIR